ncbi:inosine/xanthosine triphosphatase [Draconibacterium sp. IB214405]|uniref:inosine/xanthosine triphosphatase n=1 Tax=Draconibacterium sp. IB214405 TaxID=3097352 RepID=UPI002A12F59C|nr:inosine/xanthosine triphosphatase [Draconibacterium sp. IB214405]MDX8338572.1 inosine/xanthosine triphosphatase [Draconibacterium sp. IB214405]
MKIVVASKNPVKLNAVQLGFSTYYSKIEVEGVSVASGVSDQPKSDEETLLGAENRVRSACSDSKAADFWVGIEGGLCSKQGKLEAFAWIVISSGEKTGRARTTTFQLPVKVAELIEQGYELGHANDILFKQENSKQKTGAVGLLTNNKINRTALYKQAVELALVPFLNPDLY